MTDFLLELLSEEIPARMQAKARDDLARLFSAQLEEAGLAAESLTTYSTPRRLALIAKNLPLETEAIREKRKGPRADAPDRAIEGFLRSTGLTRDDLETRDVKGKPTLFAVIDTPGRATADVLAEAIPAIIRAFPWPKSMRWGTASVTTESLKWVRPLQGIVAILGEDLVPCDIDGIASGYDTVGHRFHHTGPITIGGAHDYVEKLRACHAIVDHEERQDMVRAGAARAAADAGLVLVEDEGLVIENAGLTEWPVPLLGSFDAAYLEVPEEVIQLTARINQKYFICRSPLPLAGGAGGGPERSGNPTPNPSREREGDLAPNFVCTANIEAADGGVAIVAGNETVLAARLSEAKFFWEQDRKVPLEDHAVKLGDIVFHEKLGTVADKVERVAKLARWLVEEGIVRPSPLQGRGGSRAAAEGEGESGSTPAADGLPLSPAHSPEREREKLADMAERAARLCKADLVTGMVGEFADLQGIMGGYYAEAQGLDPEIAAAIRDHYKPVGQGDEVPTAPVTVAVSLADKLDSLIHFIGVDEGPTGSKDPFALRRSALGAMKITERMGLRFSISKLTEFVIRWIIEEWEFGVDHKIVSGHPTSKNPNVWTTRDISSFAEAMTVETSEVLIGMREGVRSDGLPGSIRAFLVPHPAITPANITDFLADRLKVQQREAGVRHDLIDAVFALGGEDDLVRLLARVKALQAFVETDAGANLLAGYKRAANILKKEGQPSPLQGRGGSRAAAEGEGKSVSSDDGVSGEGTPPLPTLSPEGERAFPYTPEPAEAALAEALATAEPEAAAAIAAEDFEAAMSALAKLRAPIDDFFENVTVNDENEQKRNERLAMLENIRNAVHRVADFSKIEG